MNIIGRNNNLKFYLHKSFKSQLFLPISYYISWKLENDWDDYNELYHAINYINNIKNEKDIWFDIPTIQRDNKIIGVLTIVGGKIENLGIQYDKDTDNTLLLKYFHIVEKGAGLGSYWLKSIIFPYYQEKDYSKIFISSSHPKSFNFYRKLGKEIMNNTKSSDNKLYNRQSKTFLIYL